MSKMKIKPCPFCGGEGRVRYCTLDEQRVIVDGYLDVMCGCADYCVEMRGHTEEEAINKWNTRKGPLKKVKSKKVRFSHDSYAYCPHCGREIVDFLMKPGRCVKCNGEIDWD